MKESTMRLSLKVVALAGILALPIAWSFGRIGLAQAQGPAATKSARGGLLAKDASNQFEVFFYPTGVRLFPQGSTGAALDARSFSATATFYHPNSPSPWFSRPLRASAESLDLAIGLANAPRSGAKVTFVVAGSTVAEGSTSSFIVPLEFVSESATQPAAPSAAASPGPRYVYGPGYYGFGYYRYPGPQAAPAAASVPAVYGYSSPARRSSGGSSGSTHDWSTGRDLPSGGLISKPWLRPMD
jgi:hypothetical protein